MIVSWSAPKYDILRKMISWSIVSNAFLRSMKTTPFRKPLSMLTDQLFVASSKAVMVLCKEQNPLLFISTEKKHLSSVVVSNGSLFLSFRKSPRPGNRVAVLSPRSSTSLLRFYPMSNSAVFKPETTLRSHLVRPKDAVERFT